MKRNALLLLATLGLAQQAFAVAFNYQGRLMDTGSPANGLYDLQLTTHDSPANGITVGSLLSIPAVPVTNGLFTISLDFGEGVFDGNPRWLEIGVRTNGAVGPFVLLAPRQPVTPTPYAIRSENAATAASITGPIEDAQLSGNVALLNSAQTFAGSVAFDPASGPPFSVTSTNAVTNLNADLLDGVSSSGFWKLGGNANVSNNFIGTLGSEPLELRAAGTPVLRLVPNSTSPYILAGNPSNRITLPAIFGATIGGGGTTSNPNLVSDDFGTVAGGTGNLAGNTNATFDISHPTVGGGINNKSMNSYATIAGGKDNIAGGRSAAVPGGELNSATAPYSFAAGQRAKANHQGAFVWADSTASDFPSSAANQFLIRASGGVGINTTNTEAPLNVSSTDWRKLTMSNPLEVANFRFGGDGRAGNITANAWWTGSTWLRDDTNASSFAYLQHGANGRHEFRVSPPGTGNIPWNTAMVIGTNGNVGIGATSPSARLEVAGQVRITGGSPGEGKLLVSDANGLASWQSPSALSIFFGQNYSELIPEVIDNTVRVEIDGVMADDVVVINGPGFDIQRIPGFSGTNSNDQPGPNMEYPFVFEYGGPHTNILQSWHQQFTNNPAANYKALSVIIKYLNGTEAGRWNLFEMGLTEIGPGTAGRKRYTLRHGFPPNNLVYHEKDFNSPSDPSKNPATDEFRIEIDGVLQGGYPVTQIDYTNRTITLLFDYVEGGSMYGWAKVTAEGSDSKRAMSVITENASGIEISRRNFFGVFPISYQHITGFGQIEKVKEKIVISFDTWQDT